MQWDASQQWGRIWVPVVILCLVMGFSSWVRAEKVPVVSPVQDRVRITNGDWPPYLSETLADHGIASRIVTTAFKSAGIAVEYGFFPWARSYYLAEKGDWDGTAVWLDNPERQKLFYVSDPVIVSGYVFFHRKDQPFDWNRIEDLKGLRVGGTLEYDYGAAFNQAESTGVFTVERAVQDELNFRKLLMDRIDVFPMDRVVGVSILHQRFAARQYRLLTFHPKPLRKDPLHLLLTRKNPANAERMRLFNQALDRLRRAGEIERFIVEGLGPDAVDP